MKTPIIRCTSDPSHDGCTAGFQSTRRAGNRLPHTASGPHQRTPLWLAPAIRERFPELARWASSVQLLLAYIIVGGLAFAGCVSSPDESQPERSEVPSPITRDGFPQPHKDEKYYAVMASAAASAYPARFAALTVEEDETPHLRADLDLKLYKPGTDETKVTVYIDTTEPLRVRVIIAFRGTVHPKFTEPFSNWTDVGTDIKSQFFKAKHRNPLLDTDSVGEVGAGWQSRWEEALKVKDGGLREALKGILDYPEAIHMEINVVGHSLGGVVAELAGLDIEEYLHANITNYEVNVVAFNPPRLGNQAIVDEYRRRLKDRPEKFRISVFTREGDIVDDVPLNIEIPFVRGFFGTYRQVISNVAHDNLTPICSAYMYGSMEDPNAPEGSDRRLPYAPRFHVTQPFGYGAHSIDDWVGTRSKNIEYRQVLDYINPRGFRCMFAPDSHGTIAYQAGGIPSDPKLNCTEHGRMISSDDCSPTPPAPSNPGDEL